MLNVIRRFLFGSTPVRAPFNDPILGTLVPLETGWRVIIVKGTVSFAFTIGGVNRPDDALLSHAHEILEDYQSFKKAVKDYIAYESGDYPDDAKAEVDKLEIDNIALFWPTRPNDGMIFFRGSEKDIGLWRCDYIDRKPTGLGCDT
jgi:hypothetical protein